MNLRSLATFVRVSRVGSFARVAEELGTSVSTVSMQIKTLEQELDVELFDRSFRPPRLTPNALSVRDQAEKLLDAEREIRSACAPGKGLNGIYRIGFVATASVRLLPGFLSSASETEPDARFEFVTALSQTLEARVQNGELDLAVLTESGNRENDLNYTPLRQENLVFAVPEHVHQDSIVEIVGALPFLQFNPVSGIGRLIENHMQSEATSKRIERIVLESVEAIMACVNNGLGFTLLAEPDVRRYASPKVRTIRPNKADLSRTLSLIVHASRAELPEMRKLRALFPEP